MIRGQWPSVKTYSVCIKIQITFSRMKSAWKYKAKLFVTISTSKWVLNLVICMSADMKPLMVLVFWPWWESHSTHWNGIHAMMISGKFFKISRKLFLFSIDEIQFWKILKRNQVASFLGSVQGVSIEGFSTLEQSCLPNVEFISSKKEIFYDQELVSGWKIKTSYKSNVIWPSTYNRISFQNKESVVSLGQNELDEFNTIISAVKESCEHH